MFNSFKFYLVLFAFVFFEQLARMKEIICAVVFLIVGSLVEGKSKYVSVNLDAKWDSTPMLLEARYCFYTQGLYRLEKYLNLDSVSRSLKKGQGATPKKGNFNARQPMSKGQPLNAATHVVKKQKNVSRAN